ncbi:MAG: glycoside hydrolase family 32 protein [Spirochaetia bacterium]|nr:glycoside hydrolase family 32 protein [Spirochaetia bacterium]
MDTRYDAAWRPNIHFTPRKNWMNDPCGLIYWNSEYHLYFQYHPYSNNWGSMHWGHAVSNDLFHWKEKDIALSPDPQTGNIFTGSSVWDKENTCGYFQTSGIAALYTGAIPTNDPAYPLQQQCLAYSTDGCTWEKHADGPVIPNDGSPDFRDPKVIYYEPGKTWVMVVSMGYEVRFYTSANLIHWKHTSSFGKEYGSHQGVWECPELYKFTIDATTVREKWVLLVHSGAGQAPDTSGSQYFVGDFDGREFVPDPESEKESKAADQGFDFHAAQSWSNVESRIIWIGWASHTAYSHDLPTKSWRNMLSLPRELKLMHRGDDYYIAQKPAAEAESLRFRQLNSHRTRLAASTEITYPIRGSNAIELVCTIQKPTTVIITYHFGQRYTAEVQVNNIEQTITIDRSNAGMDIYGNHWRYKRTARIPGIAAGVQRQEPLPVQLFWDNSILEVFAASGLYAATALIFSPNKLEGISVCAENEDALGDINVYELRQTMEFA